MNTAPLSLSFSETVTSTVSVILPGGEPPQEVLPGSLFSTPEPPPQQFPLSLLAAQRNIREVISGIADGNLPDEANATHPGKKDSAATTADAPTPDEVLQQLLADLLAVSVPPKAEMPQHVEPRAPDNESPMPAATPQEPVPPISPLGEMKRATVEPRVAGNESLIPVATQQESAPPISPSMEVKRTTLISPQPETIRLQGNESRWAQQLQSALGERLQVQVKNQVQHATIRLDPPEMGKIDISVNIENGRMQVTIHSSSAEIGRVLQQGSNELRQNLTEQNLVQVNVQVSSQNHPREGRQSRPHSQALPEILSGVELDTQVHHEDRSVLLTV